MTISPAVCDAAKIVNQRFLLFEWGWAGKMRRRELSCPLTNGPALEVGLQVI